MKRPEVLRLEGVTGDPRREATSRVERAISACGGSVLDFRQFSNASVCLDFEIAPARLGDLRAALAATGLRLSPASLDALARRQAAADQPPAASGELPCSLAVVFFHDEPDLRIEVPAVPG